jgi:hypothetical protein
MAQAVSRRHVTAEGLVSILGPPMWYLWWTKWHWDRFSPEYFGFPRQFHSTFTLLYEKKLKNELPSSQGLHSKSEACRASVAYWVEMSGLHHASPR